MIASNTAGFSGFDTWPGTFGKVAVRLGVRPEDFDVGEAVLRQHRHGRRRAHAVQRRVDDLQIARPGRRLRQHRLVELRRRLRPGR